MKFQTDKQPPPYFNRRDQYRLLVMVGVLCFLMIAINVARKPSTWQWLVPPESQAGGSAPALEEIDFRVQAEGFDSLQFDEFRVVPDENAASGDAAATESVTGEVDMPSEVLGPIEDNTVGLRRQELDAYQLMLSRIDTLPSDVSQAAARDDVAFTVLMLQSEDYRGKLITIRGVLRRLIEFPAPQDSEFDTLYEGWLFTRDSGTNPYRIVFTQRPADVPLSEALDPPVRVLVTGYFFKRYGYASQGGQHVAPLLIAKSPRVIPTPNARHVESRELRTYMLAVIGLVVLAVGGLFLWFVSSDRRYRNSRLSQLAAARLDAAADDLAALQHVQVLDTERPFADGSGSVDSTPSVN